MSNPKSDVWFKNQPIGVHTLANTVKRLCEKGGISGYKTNHSLRVTTATRLYQNGADVPAASIGICMHLAYLKLTYAS